jgi:hypothetical protein
MALADALRRSEATGLAVPGPDPIVPDLVSDEDFQLALWISYELAYRGFDEVDDDLEWNPVIVAWRATLEEQWLAALRNLTPPVAAVDPSRVPAILAALVAADTGPPLAGYMQRAATPEQFGEFVAARSVYHLKEADPHSWGIPRLSGRAKAALIEIQADEYGGGHPERMHAALFATTMRSLGLDNTYGHYVDRAPAVVLAVSNTMSLFGLHRSHIGALLGHLAAFEMTSSLPNRRYGNGLRRLGYGAEATRFFDEHVEADAVHEQIAAHDLCGTYAMEHPGQITDILFGAASALAIEAQFGSYLLERWQDGKPALRGIAGDSTAA